MTEPLAFCWCGGSTFSRELSGTLGCEESEYHDPTSDGRPDIITTLYIAGPMSGYPDCNYPAFHDAAFQLRERGWLVTNPAEFGSNEAHYTDLLREDLRLLLDCDGVALLDRWWESTGARNEASVAGLLRMPVRALSEWLALDPLTAQLDKAEQ